MPTVTVVLLQIPSAREASGANLVKRHAGSRDGPTSTGLRWTHPLSREVVNRLLVTEGLVRTRFVVKADVLGDRLPWVEGHFQAGGAASHVEHVSATLACLPATMRPRHGGGDLFGWLSSGPVPVRLQGKEEHHNEITCCSSTRTRSASRMATTEEMASTAPSEGVRQGHPQTATRSTPTPPPPRPPSATASGSHRRPVRRDQGTARRLLSDRGEGPGRGPPHRRRFRRRATAAS